MKQPTPRTSFYMMARSNPQYFDQGTWLEPEEMCYPSGGMLRRARALCEDGKLRVIMCGIPDTFFSIPGKVRVRGKWTSGYLTIDTDNNVLRFHNTKAE